MKTIEIVFFSGHHRDFDRDQETHRHCDREAHHNRDGECDSWTRSDHYRHHETHHRHRDYHDHRDHPTDRHCRDYNDRRERERGTHHHRDGLVTKVLSVPTRPRSKRRFECRMKRESLRSYVKNLGLSPGELQEKVRKMREARDYSFLLSEECNNSVNGVQENDNARLYSALTISLNQNNPHQLGAAASKLSKVESDEKKHGGSPRSLLGFVPDDDDDVLSSRKKGSERRREGGESAAKKRRTCKIDGRDDEQ